MATLGDIGMSALINILGAFAFLLAFALLRIQPLNDRVYFTKWYIEGQRSSPSRRGDGLVGRFVNLNYRTYLTFLNWMPQALQMKEPQIIEHAGLDSAVFLRIYRLGLKIFGPIAIVAAIVLFPVNASGGTLFFLQHDLVVNNIDKLSISNIHPKSNKHPAQFTVLVRNVPRDPNRSISETVDNFFQRNHPDYYLCHQSVYKAKKFAKLVKKRIKLQNQLNYNQLKFERNPKKRPTRKKGFLGLWGERVDSIDYFEQQIKDLDEQVKIEREKVMKDPKAVTRAAFVSFKTRWGAAVCAQTQQSKNPTLWLTYWAPEPRDIYWKNLGIPFVSLSIRKLIISVAMFGLIFFYFIPVAFVQSLANIEGLSKALPFLRPILDRKLVKSFLQGFVPGLALKIFLLLLPSILMVMSKIEGHVAVSVLEQKTAAKYYYFMLVNVFLGSIATGTAFQQLNAFLHQSATEIPRNIGVSIPMKASFFITYIMIDGWAGIAGEILRLKPLAFFHLKRMFLVKTERDLEKAMRPKGVDFPETLPSLQLYFLLGIVYMAVTPILLPFILVFFAFAYFVYRHQVINVYNQKYESAAAFWPHVHNRIIASLVVSQLLLMGLLSTKKATNSTPLLVVLPILTLTFHKYCKHRFEPAFRNDPLEESMSKDLEDGATELDGEFKSQLMDAYLHPIFHNIEGVEDEIRIEKN
ncbi:CSC1-like protein At1g32090 isoform X2 [Salvia hispanica]|uniref:CSC1-like protein At1g32090 isoform X2 n=1 Tax=Salvia hispanica TaxID=49212 RepID=UPI0020096117|nr:CSC1-like protein At1g32090 isoform X2 [Salvia hispanica]